MKLIGAHVSAAGGVENAPLNAAKIGAKSFALFTKNQRQWAGKALTTENIDAFKKNCEDNGYLSHHILPHDSYLINLGHHDPEKLLKSRDAFTHEMHRCMDLDLCYLNFHPGSHLKKIEEDKCLDLIGESINMSLEQSKGVTAVLETTAGQGTNMGFKFEHMAHIIDKVEDKSRVAVCIDTCHIFTAGYDIRTQEAYDKTMTEFDNVIGFEYLKGFHLNDSKPELGSRVDRHDSIGKGKIGVDAFNFLMNDDRIDDIPMVLETIDETIWAQEIELLYSLVK
jgi:deoxyribonuclease-4